MRNQLSKFGYRYDISLTGLFFPLYLQVIQSQTYTLYWIKPSLTDTTWASFANLCLIFGVSSFTLSLSKAEADCIAFAMFLAQFLILLKWKDSFSPSFTQWFHDLQFFIKLEKIKFSLRG